VIGWWPFKHKHHWYYYWSEYMPSTRWCFGCAGLEYETTDGLWEPAVAASDGKVDG
jgi:hypothetical protein